MSRFLFHLFVVSGPTFLAPAGFAVVPLAQQGATSTPETLAVGDPLDVLGLFQLNDAKEPFERTLGQQDEFGAAVASLGDLDGDGNQEYAIGAPGDFQNRGAVWIFSLRPDRSVAFTVKYGPIENLPFALDMGDRFGTSVTALGDLDGDGIGDVAVGAPGDDDGTVPPISNAGAVWILFFRSDATIRTAVKFSRTEGGFPGLIESGDAFGTSVASAGDLDKNGVEDLLVGTPNNDDGGNNRGAFWVLFLAQNHSVQGAQKISQTQGGLGITLGNSDRLGSSLANLGDLDGDGTIEVAAGLSAQAGEDYWLLSLDSDGMVTRALPGTVPPLNGAASAVSLGDIDGDGVGDLALGDAVASGARIAVVLLNANGTVKSDTFITTPQGYFATDFGRSLAMPGDTDGDGRPELVMGVPEFSDRALSMGAMLISNLSPLGALAGPTFRIDAVAARVPVAPTFTANESSEYGSAIASLGDVDGDGLSDVAVGSPGDNDGGRATGAVWIHHLSALHGRRVDKLSQPFGNLPLVPEGQFGFALAPLGDLDGNGVIDLAVGAPGNMASNGGLWIVHLSRFSRALSIRFLSKTEAGFDAGFRGFGGKLVPIGDLDGNGVTDLVASSDRGLDNRILFMGDQGQVLASRALDRSAVPSSTPGDGFGEIVADYGPRSGGGRLLLVKGANTGIEAPIWRLEMDSSGQVLASTKIVKRLFDLASPGDLDGDGIWDLAVFAFRSSFAVSEIRLELLNSDLSARQSRFYDAGIRPHALTRLGDITGDGVPDLGGTASFAGTGRVFLPRLGGVATADFERFDDVDADWIENGRALPPEQTGRTFTITTEGAHLGAAAFDSTRGGPNTGGGDPDLLVGSGRVLILQDSLHGTQTVPGIFDSPNDDADGGLLRFDFRLLVRPLSIRLIDVDPGSEQTTIVTLYDTSDRLRTWFVPGGFTEDRTLQSGLGWRRLDLTTLDPQPGFVATATATESPGFDSGAVRRMEIHFGSSGAVDDLVFDPYP